MDHAKLAQIMGTVYISTSRPMVVKNNSLGLYLSNMPQDEKMPILKKMTLSTPYIGFCIQQLINMGELCYQKTLPELTKDSIYRRRTSIRQVMEFVLQETEYSDLLQHIDWEVR